MDEDEENLCCMALLQHFSHRPLAAFKHLRNLRNTIYTHRDKMIFKNLRNSFFIFRQMHHQPVLQYLLQIVVIF